ncbi:hypothetical protein HPB51_016533 [Rhipicephalus microplus]|uniref:THAP-type domain-containing protein n=1 Tax=Rhipicephalus microplus TaxID=6941 RepID=A0A9J6E271_RHIMP|nr:hypothetical protein HPB51_016533 [Rhipicephalus microplus]
MPCKCCVPRCRGNYTVDTKVHVFKFPRDQTLRNAWIRAVPREDLSVAENSRVCELHFREEDIIREASHTDVTTGRTITVPLSHVHLRPDAVPSKFPSCPTYLSRETTRREDPDSKRARMEHAAMQKAIAESEEMFNRAHEEDKVHSLGELIGHLRSKKMKFWNIIEKEERLVIIHIVDDEAPWLKYSVCVKGDMSVTVHVMRTAVRKLGANLVVPEIADSKSGNVQLLEGIEKWDGDLMSDSVAEICETVCLLLDQLSTPHAEDDGDCIRFLREQVRLFQAKKQRRRYSADFMVFCCILFTISPRAYAYIRSHGSIILPHPMTIRSVCSSYGMNPQQEHQSETVLTYMARRISDLKDDQRFVTVMVDEIHIKPYFDYKGGNITGAAFNSVEAANCALIFMVRSLTCKFKEVAHIVPVHRLDAEFLHKMLKNVICGLEKIGYRVVCVVSDNSSVNRKAMSHFESTFFNRIVYQHLSDPARPLFFVIDPVDILKCIRNNWINQKNDQVCFYFPEMQTDTAQSERMQTASFSTIRDLHSKESKHNLFSFEATATFIDIILEWWKIVNVKTPWKGKRLRDQFQQPVFSVDNDPKVDFLLLLLKWLDEWKNRGLDKGTLTKETHAALEHTTYALVELARQIYEVENKLRLQSTLPTISTEQHWECVRKQVEALHPSCNVVVSSETLSKIQEVLPILVYVAGYAVYTTLKRLNCAKCKDVLTVDKTITVSAAHEHYDLVKQLDRGGLVYPSMFALNAVAHCYVVVEQLATQPELLLIREQRQVVTELTLHLLANEEPSDFDTCENGHTSESVLKHILRCSTNILLKNVCGKLNDKLLDAADEAKKRKATTLQNKQVNSF